ncbi:hypothetical protein ACVW21_002878, partial [Salmonella enterica subsp. enterica serovar Agona]
FALTITCCFAKTFEEEKNCVMYVLHNHACKYHVYRASEIYAWRGQTPFVMSIAAVRQRSSHHRPGIARR